MKKLLYLFLLASQVIFGQESFDQANELYRKDQFEAAVTAYENILKTKKHSAELYFNLGNAYYKLNQVAPAIYNYEKALLLDPDDTEISNNLKFAQQLQIDDIKQVNNVGFGKWLQDFTSAYHYNTWGGIAIGCSTLFLVFFVGYYFSETTRLKRIFFILMFVALLVIVLSVFAAIFEKTRYQNDQPAIVFAEVVSVKTEPKSDAPDAFVLHEGSKVQVVESLDHWKKITLPDGTTGWIDQNAIKLIKSR